MLKIPTGSDCLLVPMPAYRDFVRELIPEAWHPAEFHDNARTLFRL